MLLPWQCNCVSESQCPVIDSVWRQIIANIRKYSNLIVFLAYPMHIRVNGAQLSVFGGAAKYWCDDLMFDLHFILLPNMHPNI